MLNLTDSQIDDMAEDMRLWAGANANRQIARKANWSMAFKSWMRREAAKQGKINGTGTSAVTAAGQRVIARAEARERDEHIANRGDLFLDRSEGGDGTYRPMAARQTR